MGIGGGIALIVVGAILSFGISDALDGVNLAVIGYICMGAGVIAIILAVALQASRNNTSHREVIEQRGTPAAPAATPVAPVVAPVQQAPVQQVPVQQQQPPAAPPAV